MKIEILNRLFDYRKRENVESRFELHKLFRFERRWKKELSKYKSIRVIGIEFKSIGETFQRLTSYFHNIKPENDIYSVVLPVFFDYYKGGIHNPSIFEIFRNTINFITIQDIDFWIYLVLFHGREIDDNDFYKFKNNPTIVYKVAIGKSIVTYDQSSIIKGDEYLKMMGVNKKYVCIHFRESITYKINFIDNYPDTSCVDASLDSLYKTCELLESLGYQSIRMGKDEIKPCNLPGCIDYANFYYDPWMDFYILSHCGFVIGCDSGITGCAGALGVPVLWTNVVVFIYGWESMTRTDYDLYIPKKYYSRRLHRLLNLKEMLIVSNECDRYNIKFQYKGIEIIDNTSAEIYEATQEFIAKLNGSWNVSDQEKKDMEIYWDIIAGFRKSHDSVIPKMKDRAQGYCMVDPPISYTFLRRNRYLIDGKNSDIQSD